MATTFRVISLPPFRAAISGVSVDCAFTPDSVLGKFDQWFSNIKLTPRDSFMPRDFLYFDEKRNGMVWMYALSEDIDPGEFEVIDFPGGLYLTYAYRDGGMEENAALFNEAMLYLTSSDILMSDKDRTTLGHVITPKEVAEAQGWAQMETYIPVKLM